VLSDVRQDAPLDAAAELEKLPPPEPAPRADDEDVRDPALAAKRRLGGPVPGALYGATAAAGVLGLVLGILYQKYVLDLSTMLVPVLFAFLLEAFVAAWFARRKLGRALTTDQRARVAITYTLGASAVWAVPTALGWLPGSKRLLDRLEGLSPQGIVAAVAIVALALATIALARFLVLAVMAVLVPSPKTQERAA
jgi:hypothetical protein